MRKNSARLLVFALLSLALVRCSPVASSISKKAPPSTGGNTGEAVTADAPASPKKENAAQTLTALQVVVYQTRVISEDDAATAQEQLQGKGFKLVSTGSDAVKAGKIEFDAGVSSLAEGITVVVTDTSADEIASRDWSEVETTLSQVQGTQWKVSINASAENEELWKDLSSHIQKVQVFVRGMKSL